MVKERLLVILNKISNTVIDAATIDKATSLINDFNFNSIKMVELIVSIESEFNISIDDDDLELEKLDSLDNLIGMIKAKMDDIGSSV